jgi:hypothetical protein
LHSENACGSIVVTRLGIEMLRRIVSAKHLLLILLKRECQAKLTDVRKWHWKKQRHAISSTLFEISIEQSFVH